MTDLILELLQKLWENGLSWGVVVTVLLIYRKHRRNQRLNARDARWEAKLDAIMKEVGAACADTCKPITEPSAATRAGGSLSCWPGRSFARSAKPRTNSNTRRMEMKDYLRKLGKTKFQAYLLVTIINIVTFVAYLKGWIHIEDQIDQFMPVLNLIVQLMATLVYQWVEGSIDREAQRQQVYVMPGSAPAPDNPAAQPVYGGSDLPWTEIRARVKAVNAELNAAMDHMDTGGLPDVAKAAAARYLAIYQLLEGMPPLPSQQKGVEPKNEPVSGQS